MARTGRRPRTDGDSSGTRARIADAARETFGREGFDNATIRGIARAAGVDSALVHHYFGSKQRLFLSVMSLPFDVRQLASAIVQGDREGVGERFVRFFLSVWDEQPAARSVLTGVVRSAATDPQAADLLREFLGRQGLFDLVAQVNGDRPELRAVLVGSQLIGLAMGRYIVGIEPLASLDAERVVSAFAPTIQRYLYGDIER
jgi:AcrR family transcriptional regulator